MEVDLNENELRLERNFDKFYYSRVHRVPTIYVIILFYI